MQYLAIRKGDARVSNIYLFKKRAVWVFIFPSAFPMRSRPVNIFEL